MIKLRLLNEGKFMLKSVLPLSFIIASRFLGLFIVLPVLSLYALNLEGANEFLVGLIVGIYAISQMIFQVPFGALSDKIGRKKALTIGLLVFVVGSIVCALASDIYTMLFGRHRSCGSCGNSDDKRLCNRRKPLKSHGDHGGFYRA